MYDKKSCIFSQDGHDYPRPIHRVNPNYPLRASERGREGWVEIEASIGSKGEVTKAVVLDSDPPGLFDRSALRAYKQWRYCPPSDLYPYPDRIQTRLLFALR
jgi:TonB family protein